MSMSRFDQHLKPRTYYIAVDRAEYSLDGLSIDLIMSAEQGQLWHLLKTTSVNLLAQQEPAWP